MFKVYKFIVTTGTWQWSIVLNRFIRHSDLDLFDNAGSVAKKRYRWHGVFVCACVYSFVRFFFSHSFLSIILCPPPPPPTLPPSTPPCFCNRLDLLLLLVHSTSFFPQTCLKKKKNMSWTVNQNFICGSEIFTFALIWPSRLTGRNVKKKKVSFYFAHNNISWNTAAIVDYCLIKNAGITTVPWWPKNKKKKTKTNFNNNKRTPIFI